MRAFNVLLSIAISIVMLLLALEGGLRLIGKGPPATLVRFDADTGWSKRPDAEMTRSTPAFRVHYATNAQGLRDDPLDLDAPKRDGEFRVLALGDSFTFGWGVERDQHFVDLLEGYWRSEGRDVSVINAGTEGWDTAQAVRWLEVHGARYQPDLVLLFPYDNDLYWNSQDAYVTGDGSRREKPRYDADGRLVNPKLAEPAPKPWHKRLALTQWIVKPDPAVMEPHHATLPGAGVRVFKEFLPLVNQAPAAMVEPIERHTLGALRAFAAASAKLGAAAVVAPIPSGANFEDDHRERLAQLFGALPEGAWSPARPVETVARLAAEAGLRVVDARAALASARQAGERLYHPMRADWHFNENGSRHFAEFLHGALEGVAPLPPKRTEGALPPVHVVEAGLPFAAKLYIGLLAGLSVLFWITYPKENRLLAVVKIAALLGLVFGIFIGLTALQRLLPPAVAQWLVLGFVAVVLGFVVYKLGRRTGTIAELMTAFVRRGHWYLMPLVVVLVTIGSLLVVAASSPLVAPFIYTLF